MSDHLEKCPHCGATAMLHVMSRAYAVWSDTHFNGRCVRPTLRADNDRLRAALRSISILAMNADAGEGCRLVIECATLALATKGTP